MSTGVEASVMLLFYEALDVSAWQVMPWRKDWQALDVDQAMTSFTAVAAASFNDDFNDEDKSTPSLIMLVVDSAEAVVESRPRRRRRNDPPQ